LSNSFYNLLVRLYQKRRDKLIGNCYYFLNSLNSIAPSIINLDEVKKVLVLAPHPDDEAIGCGGTLRRLTENGCRGETVFLTNGKKDKFGDHEEIARVRRNEALNSAKELGMGKSHFLDYYDRRLKPDKEVLEFVLSLLKEMNPDMVFSPFFLDNHPDHNETAKILALASTHYSKDFICCCYELWSTLTPNYLVDISSFFDKKVAAILSHKSQASETDFVGLAKGLNRYRAIASGQPFQYAEAFFVASKNDFIKMSNQF